MPWTDAYIDLPFRRDGRDRRGVDCWGLVRLVYAERLGLILPDHLGIFTATDAPTLRRIAVAMEREAARWTLVEEPVEYDVVLMSRVVGGIPVHVGLCVGGGGLLHICEGANSTCEPLARSLWTPRILGFYRHG